MASHDTIHFDAQTSDVIRKAAKIVSDYQNSTNVRNPLVKLLKRLAGPMLEIVCSVVKLQSHSGGTQPVFKQAEPAVKMGLITATTALSVMKICYRSGKHIIGQIVKIQDIFISNGDNESVIAILDDILRHMTERMEDFKPAIAVCNLYLILVKRFRTCLMAVSIALLRTLAQKRYRLEVLEKVLAASPPMLQRNNLLIKQQEEYRSIISSLESKKRNVDEMLETTINLELTTSALLNSFKEFTMNYFLESEVFESIKVMVKRKDLRGAQMSLKTALREWHFIGKEAIEWSTIYKSYIANMETEIKF